MVGSDGRLPLPWLAPALDQALHGAKGHALLLHGPAGVGQFELGLTLAQAWLCEASAPGTAPAAPCGHCAGCKLVQAHSHPDLLVLMPEVLQLELGWNVAEGEEGGGSERTSKTKPSAEIKVEAVRRAVGFAQTTSARGRGKVVVLHPAERMNGISANTLLKTLEEPVGETRFVLSCSAPDALLPTIRSRCQAVALQLPAAAEAGAWLAAHEVADAPVLLAATGSQPQEALRWSREGLDAAAWLRVPALVAGGAAQSFAGWPLPRVVDVLQKLGHDALCLVHGAPTRYFPASALAATGADVPLLTAWLAELRRVARHAEHPWNAGLLVESLVQQGQRALAKRAKSGTPGRGAPAGLSVHSRT